MRTLLSENLGTIFSITFGIIILAMTIFLLLKIGEMDNSQETEKVELCSLEASNGTHGSFVLGCGSIQNETYYAGYKINSDGGKEHYKMPASQTVIYETLPEGGGAYAEVTKDGFGFIRKIKLYIPKNTIQKEIVIN